jgi:Calpain family cysteine protease/UBA-like domain
MEDEVVIIVIDSDDESSLTASQQETLALFRSIVPHISSEKAVTFLNATNWNVELALDQSFSRSPPVATAPPISNAVQPAAEREWTDSKESLRTTLSEQWLACVESTRQAEADHFIDPDFPPALASLDGRTRAASSSDPTTTLCFCGLPAAPKQVQSEGPNYGRFFLVCGRSTRARPWRRSEEIKTTETNATKKLVPDPNHLYTVAANQTNETTAASTFLRNPYKKSKIEESPSKMEHESPTETEKDAAVERETPCSFFQWDTTGVLGTINASSNGGSGYGGTIRNLSWFHFGLDRGCVLYRQHIHVSQIRQGTVGDCWFLSALAVVAEKPYLIQRILPHTALNTTGCYQINLFLDGTWQPILVDSYLPVVVKPRGGIKSHSSSSARSRVLDGIPVLVTSKNTSNDGAGHGVPMGNGSLRTVGAEEYVAVPAFCATPDRQLWPALIEKAYAKAHGSYQHLSGGYIAEGLQDLTGAPTETFVFQEMSLDPDAFWMQLLSFHSAGFLIGVATYSGGDGLVGGHAYSVLDILDIPNTVVGEQSKLTDYFSSNPLDRKDKCNEHIAADESHLLDERKTLRLVRIRNPWGKREWKGDWSTDSERWTRALRKRLGHDTTYAKGDGTFYMSFEDMMQRFHHMDVAKTQQVTNIVFYAPSYI